MSKVKLVSATTKRHPDFGTSSSAKNEKTRVYTLGNLSIKFSSLEWYDGSDTDVEVYIEIGPLCFDMFPDDFSGFTESRMSMSRGKWDNIAEPYIALLVTRIEKDKDGKEIAISAKIEEGSAREMNKEWNALAKRSGLPVEEFTQCLVEEFNIFWFGGMKFLSKIAAEEKLESEEEKESNDGYSDDEW